VLTGLELGQRVKTIRGELGLSQKELALAAGMSQGYLSQVECGQVKNVSIGVAVRLAEALATDVYTLMGAKYVKIDVLPELATDISKMSFDKQRSLLELLRGLK